MIAPIKAPAPQPKAAAQADSKADASAEAGAGDDFLTALMGELEGGEEAMLPVDGVPAELSAELSASANIQAAPVKGDALNLLMEGEALPVDPTVPTPKVLDPSLIQQVNEVVLPEGAEQVQVPMKEMLMRAQGGRAPAIDLAQAEVDPQLMDMQDFVAQKNAFARKAPVTNAYGMQVKNVVGNGGNAGANAQASNELTAVLSGQPSTEADAGLTTAYAPEAAVAPAQLHDAPSASKVFDLSALKGQKVDAENLMSQITDYVVQARAAKDPTVQLKMRHEDLGLLDITVNRATDGVINIAILGQDHSAKAFLGQHRDQLLGHLTQAGVNVGDLKLDVQNSSKNDSMGGQQHAGHGQDRQFGSESNQRRHDQQRREDLWDVLREKAA